MATHLPIEIIQMIFAYLPKRAIKSARLLCKAFDYAAPRFLFNRVYVSVHRKDLDALTEIANHPRYSLCVKEVIYTGVYFHDRPRRRTKAKKPDSYARYYEQQKDVMQGAKHLQIISSAIVKMPHISLLTFTNHWQIHHYEFGPHKAHAGLEFAVRYGGPFSRKFPSSVQNPCGEPPTTGDSKVRVDYGFPVMMAAMSAAGTHLESIHVDYHVDTSWCGKRDYFFRGLTPSTFSKHVLNMDQACNVFRSLRRLSLEICEPHLEPLYWDWCQEGHFARLLSAAEDLEDLGLYFDLCPAGTPSLSYYIGEHTWRRLQCLRLKGMHFTQDSVVEILRRHRSTLKIVEFDDDVVLGSLREIGRVLHGDMQLDSISLPRRVMEEMYSTFGVQDARVLGTLFEEKEQERKAKGPPPVSFHTYRHYRLDAYDEEPLTLGLPEE
ncbi:hypothetical protein AJ80_05288 [Polytolypa hystricis UAMH7299]|uniref:F-box domain-containing protein n=1 Tax=Polytolypa hystricis (strain UAMH7299) TaxID=1447883 RepID=A0A2B7Y4Y5_POLH7|nr:hypothetical protein AJ80_05288 [Polytolypa hystricis UAMH7299]